MTVKKIKKPFDTEVYTETTDEPYPFSELETKALDFTTMALTNNKT